MSKSTILQRNFFRTLTPLIILISIGALLLFVSGNGRFSFPFSHKSLPSDKQTSEVVSKVKSTRLINPKIAPNALKTKPRTHSGSVFVREAYAQEVDSIAVYPVIKFTPTKEQAASQAEKFGFVGEPTQPGEFDWEKATSFVWKNDDSSFEIIGSNNLSGYLYQHYPKDGNLPSDEEAMQTARTFLESKGLYTTDITNATVEPMRIYLFDSVFYEQYAHYNTEVDTKLVYFTKIYNQLPVTIGQFVIKGNANLTVAVGPGNEVVSVIDPMYGYTIDDQNSRNVTLKTSDQAIEEFKQTGGAINSVRPPPGMSWSTDQKLEIRDALVTSISQSYLLYDNTGFIYPEDLQEKAVSYLLPVWVFEGEGTMFGESFNGERVKFTSVVYGVRSSASQAKIVKLNNFDIDLLEVKPEATISAKFNFNFDELSGDNVYPRALPAGLRYTLVLQYPDGHSVTSDDVLREANYGEHVVLATGKSPGDLQITLTAVDFPYIKETKVVKILESVTPQP